MKKFAVLLLILPFLASCSGEDPKDKTIDSMKNVVQGKEKIITMKDTSIMGYIRMVNDIQDNIDSIKAKEKIIDAAKAEGDVPSQSDKIKADLQAIYDKMNENKQKIAAMRSQMKKSTTKMEEMQRMIDRLQQQMDAKDQEIATLKDQLEKLNVELSTLTLNYDQTSTDLKTTTDKLNSAWYAFGTKKDLLANGVITKEGGFIGIGRAEKLKSDFNKQYFTQIDVTTTKEIPLGSSKNPKVVTSHPSSSYKLEGAKIVITNSDEFWSASKYLVIIIE